MNPLHNTLGLCLPRPQKQPVASASRRVHTRHNLHCASATETTAALNLLSQGIALCSGPFPPSVASAASDRVSQFILQRTSSFLHACRTSGGIDVRSTNLYSVFPKLSSSEFVGCSGVTPIFGYSPPAPCSVSVSTHAHTSSAATTTSQLFDSSASAVSASASLHVDSFSASLATSPSAVTHHCPAQPLPLQQHNQHSLQHAHVVVSHVPDLSLGVGAYVAAHNSAGTPAVPINAHLVSLPARAGVCPATKFAPRDLADSLANIDTLLRPPGDHLPPSAPAAMLIEPGHYPPLLLRMDAAGMIAWSTVEPDVINGLFAVTKPDGSQRLIVDARRANQVFVDPPPVSLPTPDLLASLEAAAPFVCAKTDRSDYYHSLLMPASFWPKFGLPAVAPEAVGLAARFPGHRRVWPMIKTLPMGFSHAVAIGQRVHVEFIRQRVPALPVRDLISLQADLRLDRLRFSIYIDDLTVFGLHAEPVNEALDQYIQASEDEGFQFRRSKTQRAAYTGVEVTGLAINGIQGTIGVAPAKLVSLCQQTLALARAPLVSEPELSTLLGRWTWAALVRRPALSVFGSVYKWTTANNRRAAPLWPSARLELAIMCALAPLLCADLSSSWFDKTIAVDASSTGQGVVAAPLSPGLVSGLAASAGLAPADTISAQDIFDNALRAALDKQVALGINTREQLQPDTQQLLLSAHWSTIVCSRWRRAEHINILEATALRTGVSWALSHTNAINKRCLILSDSAVVVLAMAKGRSSSRALLFQCRRTAALLLGSGLRLFVRWLPSALNPADHASRSL